MPEENLPDKRAAVLKAALNLISEQGFHGTPMSQVAREADVGVGTIYRYFSSKEDLINALYTETKTRIAQAVLEGYSVDLPVKVRFIRICSNFVNYYSGQPKELRFVEQYANSPFITNFSRQEGLRMLEPVAEFLRYAQAQEVVKSIPIEVLTAIVYGSIVALVKLHLSGNVALNDTNLNLGLNALWDAIKS